MTNQSSLKNIIIHGSLDVFDRHKTCILYLHIPIHRGMQKYIAFTWGRRLFFFKVLPFGFTSAPYVFTRIMIFPLSLLRKQEVNVIAYLDDLIIWDQSPKNLQQKVGKTIETLTSLGFLIHREKCVLIPTQDLIWLGVRWLGASHEMALPTSFVDRLMIQAESLMGDHQVTLRQLETM